MSRPIADRFWEKVDTSGDCWEWTGCRNRYGYGRLGNGDGTDKAHRIAYEMFVAPIPEGMQIDHLCLNKGCVNPAHLEVVTSAENTRRWAATITCCPRGHAYTRENTARYGPKRQWRRCRECNRAVQRRLYAKQKARIYQEDL